MAVTQIGDEDKWQKATLAVAGVEKERNNMNSTLSSIINFAKQTKNIGLIDYEMELI